MMLLQHRGAEKLELARWTVVLGSTGMYVLERLVMTYDFNLAIS